MPLLEFMDQKTGKVYTYEVSKYSCERADRDIPYATSLFETLRAEDQEREDAELAKQLDAEAQQSYDPEPGSSTANPSKDVEKSMDPEGSQPGSNRWNRQQSLFLIETMPTVLAEYERSNKKKHEAYEEVAKLLKEKGHRFAVEQVKNKWLLLQRLYKQNLDLKGTSGAGKITWEYFQVMEEKLGRRRENDPVATFSSTGIEKKSKNTGKSEDQSMENVEVKKDSDVPARKRKSSTSSLLEYLEAKKTEGEEKEKAKQKRHEEKMKVKEAGIKILENILNKL